MNSTFHYKNILSRFFWESIQTKASEPLWLAPNRCQFRSTFLFLQVFHPSAQVSTVQWSSKTRSLAGRATIDMKMRIPTINSWCRLWESDFSSYKLHSRQTSFLAFRDGKQTPLRCRMSLDLSVPSEIFIIGAVTLLHAPSERRPFFSTRRRSDDLPFHAQPEPLESQRPSSNHPIKQRALPLDRKLLNLPSLVGMMTFLFTRFHVPAEWRLSFSRVFMCSLRACMYWHLSNARQHAASTCHVPRIMPPWCHISILISPNCDVIRVMSTVWAWIVKIKKIQRPSSPA